MKNKIIVISIILLISVGGYFFYNQRERQIFIDETLRCKEYGNKNYFNNSDNATETFLFSSSLNTCLMYLENTFSSDETVYILQDIYSDKIIARWRESLDSRKSTGQGVASLKEFQELLEKLSK